MDDEGEKVINCSSNSDSIFSSTDLLYFVVEDSISKGQL